MGMSPSRPCSAGPALALPVIMAVLRTALVLLVGTGAFVMFIDAGGLGLLIQTGIVLFRFPLLVGGDPRGRLALMDSSGSPASSRRWPPQGAIQFAFVTKCL